MSRKTQSQKKRHTKPCKYFQVNKCPHSADVCDFAHVIGSPVIPLVFEGGSAMCRYYHMGHCANGALCRYQHGTEPSPGDWVGMEAYIDSPPPQYGSYPSFAQSWSSSVYSVSSPVESALFAVPPRSRDSIDTISTSLSSLESDDFSVVTEDPQYTEHSHLAHQSQVCIADDSPVIHIPPFPPLSYLSSSGPLSPSHGYDLAYSAFKLPPPLKLRSNSLKSPSKQKALKYKTKPCKFFPTERGCPNGSECTFIHDGNHLQASSLTHQSAVEDGARKNFIPIPWRVIGGGVLVGVKRDNHEDDDSVFESDDDSSSYSKTPTPIKVIPRPRSNSIPPTPCTAQVKMEHLFSAESPGVL